MEQTEQNLSFKIEENPVLRVYNHIENLKNKAKFERKRLIDSYIKAFFKGEEIVRILEKITINTELLHLYNEIQSKCKICRV